MSALIAVTIYCINFSPIFNYHGVWLNIKNKLCFQCLLTRNFVSGLSTLTLKKGFLFFFTRSHTIQHCNWVDSTLNDIHFVSARGCLLLPSKSSFAKNISSYCNWRFINIFSSNSMGSCCNSILTSWNEIISWKTIFQNKNKWIICIG